MSQRELLIIAVALLTAGNCANAHAQGAQSTQPTQATVQPQGAAQNSTANPSSANSASVQSTQKKVWTNDELNGQDQNTGVSTVGKDSNSTSKRTVSARPVSANGRNAKWYRDQVVRLQAKVLAFDSQIADLQAALDGKATGDGKKSVRSFGVRMDDWSRELANFSKSAKTRWNKSMCCETKPATTAWPQCDSLGKPGGPSLLTW